ncbi:MAG: hypothetical protein U5K38_17165 [Woeseiaceae bacterium]|nr:hypothetical protein [Woeseiaceae bacterium]
MSDDCVGPALEECPVCGAVGLPERIALHDCAAFRTWQDSVDTDADADTTTEEVANDD